LKHVCIKLIQKIGGGRGCGNDDDDNDVDGKYLKKKTCLSKCCIEGRMFVTTENGKYFNECTWSRCFR
jgi:hypothetical protein